MWAKCGQYLWEICLKNAFFSMDFPSGLSICFASDVCEQIVHTFLINNTDVSLEYLSTSVRIILLSALHADNFLFKIIRPTTGAKKGT